ncbi:hypothetical protein, partial [Streptobacillus moniliformis]|uniref:hypothetical protein n=1 Tax=Streptobacillus moniliformis TaxID=34105 RepID=UPI001E4CDB9D
FISFLFSIVPKSEISLTLLFSTENEVNPINRIIGVPCFYNYNSLDISWIKCYSKFILIFNT